MHDHAERLSLSIWDSPFWRLINYNHISHHLLPSLLNRRDILSSPDSATRIIVRPSWFLSFLSAVWLLYGEFHLAGKPSRALRALPSVLIVTAACQSTCSLHAPLPPTQSLGTDWGSINPTSSTPLVLGTFVLAPPLHLSLKYSAPAFRAQRMEQMRTGSRNEQPLDRSVLVK